MRQLALFVAMSSANYFLFVGSRFAVVLYAVELGASTAVVGMLPALFGMTGAVLSLYGGRIVDRAGARRPMLWCSVTLVPATAIGALWPSLVSLFVLSAVVGGLFSVYLIGHAQSIGTLRAPEQRVGNFNAAALGFSAAALLAPVAAGAVIDRFGYGAAFVLLASLPVFPVLLLALRRIAPPNPAATRGGENTEPRETLHLVQDRTLFRIYRLSVVVNVTWSIVSFLVPVYCARLGFSASSIGLIMGAFSAAELLVRIGLLLASRFSSWRVLIASLGFCGICFVVFPMTSSVVPLATLAFLIGLGTGPSGPLLQALLYEASPPGRVGEVIGLNATVSYTTTTLVPLACGVLSAALGTAPVFWGLAALLLGTSFAARDRWRES